MRFAGFKKQPLRSQILFVYIPLLLLSILLVFFFINSANTQNKRQEAYYQLENSTDVMCLLLEERFENILSTFVSIEDSAAFSKLILNSRYGDANGVSYDDRISMGNMLDDIYSQYFSIIDSVYIQINGAEFAFMKRHSPLFQTQKLRECYTNMGSSHGQYIWSALHKDTIFTATERNVFSITKFYGNPNSKNGLLGMMTLNINEQYIMQLLKNMPISKSGYWVLMAGGQLFTLGNTSSDYLMRDGATNFLVENCGYKGHFETRSTESMPMYVHFDTFGNNDWGIAAVMPISELKYAAAPLQYESLILLIAVIVFMLFCAVNFSNAISRSLRELGRRVECFDSGALPDGLPDTRFHLEGCKEVMLLSDTLDDMVMAINRLVQEVQHKQTQLHKTELAALQEQIKPHFIYNSLSTVLYEVDSGKNAQAGEMLRALITFFRLGVNRGGDVSTVSEEIAHVESYLRIQKIRQCCLFDYHIQVDEDLSDCELLKFTLQPIVENCFAHGFLRDTISDRDNQIALSVFQSGDDIVLEVLDNGAGIPTDRLQQLNEEIHNTFSEQSAITYGLKNVDMRIRLKYGTNYGVSVESEFGAYTLVKILLPICKVTPSPGC